MQTTETTRPALGTADISDDDLRNIVGRSVQAECTRILSCTATEFAYDLEAITTAGRFVLKGTALCADHQLREFSLFVKVVQSFRRWPMFMVVPEELRESALSMLAYEVEPEIYRSDLADRLPPGLRMATAYAVREIDDESAALWLEYAGERVPRWNQGMFERAAYLLGRLAASPEVAPLATMPSRSSQPRTIRGYVEGRVAHQVIPALRSDELWEHPLIASHVDTRYRRDIIEVVDRLPHLLDELDGLPEGASHGDACTRNLLVSDRHDDFVLIDFGFWGVAPIGFDLGQLIVGEMQTGERPASWFPTLEEICLPAYVRGLRDEGCDAPIEQVRRAHAITVAIFSGLSAAPLEHLGEPVTPELHRISRERAAMGRHIVDLLATTDTG